MQRNYLRDKENRLERNYREANQKYCKRKQRIKQGSHYSETPVNKSISPSSPQLEIHNRRCIRDVITP